MEIAILAAKGDGIFHASLLIWKGCWALCIWEIYTCWIISLACTRWCTLWGTMEKWSWSTAWWTFYPNERARPPSDSTCTMTISVTSSSWPNTVDASMQCLVSQSPSSPATPTKWRRKLPLRTSCRTMCRRHNSLLIAKISQKSVSKPSLWFLNMKGQSIESEISPLSRAQVTATTQSKLCMM